MHIDKINELIEQGEGTEVEFKSSSFKLNKDAFESICAFLNRKGGHLLLGVSNSGKIEGVFDDSFQSVIDELTTQANNPQKLNPPFYLSPEVVKVQGKNVIHVLVPESSQVHQTAGKIFDRNEDGDFNITSQNERVAQLYLRKQSTYSENKIYPHVQLSDFKQELFQRIRSLARNERPDHPWLALTDEELLRSAGLFKKDYLTGNEGYTLAAILLLGKDEVIQDILPAYKTDAIKRVDDLNKYDDRDEIRTNLIESYDRLMAFVRKHLPDVFHQEGQQRISLRDRLFHEIIANLLVHREFMNPFPAKFIIEGNQVVSENWNRPHGNGLINPDYFSPFPKNPVIAKFFKEIGRVEELGSGVRNSFKYGKLYSGGEPPEFLEEDVFQVNIPVYDADRKEKLQKIVPSNIMRKISPEKLGEKLGKRLGERLGESEQKIFHAIAANPQITIVEMAKEFDLSTTAVENNIKKLKQKNFIIRVGSARGGSWQINL